MTEAQPQNPGDRTGGRPYRVLQLTSTTVIGGTERMVLQLVKRMNRDLFEPIVLSLIRAGEFIDECKREGIEAELLDCRHPLHLRPWARFLEIVRRRQIDLVHLYGLRANLPGRPVARRGGVRAVVAGIRNIDPWRKWYHSTLDRWTARWVDRFVSNSEAGRRIAIEREGFEPSRVLTIHSGIEPKRRADSYDRSALRRKFEIAPETSPVVAVIANLREQKRHRDLVDAAAALAEKMPSLTFLCAGRDRMQGEVQRYAVERGVGRQFRWLDYVANVDEVIAASDFCALPSSFEGLPASILEVMAMGRTIIATPVGGVPEVVQDGRNGLIVPVGEPAKLAQAIERLATDESLRRGFENEALATIERDFSVDRMVERTEKLYLELLEG